METFEQIRQQISPKLTWEIFEEVLKKQHDSDSVKLINISLGEPTKKGDSYLSTILRFSVEYTGEKDGVKNDYKLHVISKALLKNIAHRKTFRNSDFFTNEVIFYSQMWPQLDAFQKRMNCANLFQEIPKYLAGHYDGTNDYVLLEDLSFQGYEGVSRADALTFDRARLVLKILAQFHALGYAFRETEPELFLQAASTLYETYFHERIRGWYAKFHTNLKNITLDAVQKELPEEYVTKFKKIMDHDLYGEVSVLCSPDAPTKFKTITHGDTWMPNFLTRYDSERKPLHSVMIDFQLTRYSSLAQDLHFFIYACTDANLRATMYEDMLKFYCQEFNAFVGNLNPKLLATESGLALTYDALIEELKLNGSFALCMSMEASIMSMLEDDEVSDLDQIEGEVAVPLDSVWIVKNLKTKEKREKLSQIVKHLMDFNYI